MAIALSWDNSRKRQSYLRQAVFSHTFTRRQRESLLNSLNYVAEVVPWGACITGT